MHTVGAVYYFLILFALVIGMTIVAYNMRQWDVTFMKRGSLWIKILLAGYLLALWLYCLVGLIFEYAANDDDVYIVIVEWNSVFVGLVWVLSFTRDWKNVYLGFNTQKQEQIEN